jgi:hypothetical protein
MGKELSKLRSKREARERLKAIDSNRSLTLIIHYSCESFYDIKDGRTPRITSIAIRNFESGQTHSFSIHKSAEQNGIGTDKITEHFDDLERKMLREFFNHVKNLSAHKFIHWNMRDINYGFQAIEHRFKVLGAKPEVIDDSKKVDLARELVTLYGKGYAPHGESGRMHSIVELNKITIRDALTGAQEAEAFENGEFVQLHQSTLRKVDVIANILDRTIDGSLLTTATFRERTGLHPAMITEYLKEHWAWTIFMALAALASIVAVLNNLFF